MFDLSLPADHYEGNLQEHSLNYATFTWYDKNMDDGTINVYI